MELSNIYMELDKLKAIIHYGLQDAEDNLIKLEKDENFIVRMTSCFSILEETTTRLDALLEEHEQKLLKENKERA